MPQRGVPPFVYARGTGPFLPTSSSDVPPLRRHTDEAWKPGGLPRPEPPTPLWAGSHGCAMTEGAGREFKPRPLRSYTKGGMPQRGVPFLCILAARACFFQPRQVSCRPCGGTSVSAKATPRQADEAWKPGGREVMAQPPTLARGRGVLNTPAKKSRAVRRAYPPKSTIVNHCHPTKTLGPVFANPSPLKLRRGLREEPPLALIRPAIRRDSVSCKCGGGHPQAFRPGLTLCRHRDGSHRARLSARGEMFPLAYCQRKLVTIRADRRG